MSSLPKRESEKELRLFYKVRFWYKYNTFYPALFEQFLCTHNSLQCKCKFEQLMWLLRDSQHLTRKCNSDSRFPRKQKAWKLNPKISYICFTLHTFQYLLYNTANSKARCTVSGGWAPFIGAVSWWVTHSSVSTTSSTFIVLELDYSKQRKETCVELKMGY